MARTPKPKAPATSDPSPKADGEAAAGADNAPVTHAAPTEAAPEVAGEVAAGADLAPATPTAASEVVPPVGTDATDTAQPDGAAAGAVVPDLPPPAAVEPVRPDAPRRGFVLRVRALQPVRWRIGRPFTTEAAEIDAEGLSDEKLRALMDDPLLAVDVIAPE